jgi:hypothetical protein
MYNLNNAPTALEFKVEGKRKRLSVAGLEVQAVCFTGMRL